VKEIQRLTKARRNLYNVITKFKISINKDGKQLIEAINTVQ